MVSEGDGIGGIATQVAIVAAGVAVASLAEKAVSFVIGAGKKDTGGKKGGKKRRPARKS